MKKIDRFFPLAYILVALIPALITFVLVGSLLHSSILQFVPVYSDEVAYWHETASYLHSGFNTGYYSFNEVPASASFTPFDPHGPVIVVFNGLIARLVGWAYPTPVVINLVIITLALGFYLFVIKPRWGQLGYLAGYLAVCWPVLFFIPTGMEETLNQAAGILFAALIFILLKDGAKKNIYLGLALAFLVFFSSLRFTWLMMLPVFIFAGLRQPGWKKVFLLVLSSVLLIILGTRFFISLNAPYPIRFVTEMMAMIKRSIPDGLSYIISHARYNFSMLAPSGIPFNWETLTRVQLISFSIISVIGVVVFRRKMDSKVFWVLFAVILPIFLAQIIFYEIDTLLDVRIFAPYLIFAVFLIIAARPKNWAWISLAMILSSAILISPFINAYQSYHLDHFHTDTASIETTRSQIGSLIQYEPSDSRWCNTIATNMDVKELLGIPPGFGITFIMEAKNMGYPYHSRYFLLRDEGFARSKPVHLKKLGDINIGFVYENLDAGCR